VRIVRLVRTFFQTWRSRKRKARSGQAPERAAPGRRRERTVVDLDGGSREDTVVRGQAPKRQAKTQTSGDRRLSPSKLLV
jgi:hypothetical protein